MTRMEIARLSLATAALLAISAQPVMAKPGTRSGDALPRYSQISSRPTLTYYSGPVARQESAASRPGPIFDRPRFNP
ncbi:MAG TPA: hypothetical protein VEZ26_05830, partial [Sphingomonadaceae bacterium]|nr:hypothetical protein [Sphingomonadaceae bacterium]